MTETERLLALEEIKQLRARYCFSTDTKDWAGFAAVFAPDAEFDHRRSFQASDPATGASRVYGRPELLAAIDTSGWKWTGRENIGSDNSVDFSQVSTVHLAMNPQIAFVTPDHATGIWAMQDMLRFPDDSPVREIRGWGHYHETYTRRKDRWLIQTTTLVRLRIDVA